MVLTSAVVGMAVLASVISGGRSPFYPVAAPLRPPTFSHLMGTDQFGRDVFSCVAFGARTSLTMVVCVSAISAVTGIVVGALSGYRGGLVDSLLMRFTEVLQSIPRFFFAILAVTVFGGSVRTLVLVLGLTSWPFLARVVRAETLSLRSRDFVRAAESQGASAARVALRHLLPNVLPTAVVVIALLASRVVLLEAGLAFLGLTDPETMSWGILVKNASSYLRVAWWISVFPGLAIVASVLGLNLISDALNDEGTQPERPGPLS